MNTPWTADVFLLAENRLLREALVRLLAKKSDIRVVGANPYSLGVHEEIIQKSPGILVLDSSGLSFSNASFISTLRLSIPDLRIVMVDMDADEDTFFTAVREGIVGYVLKDASAVEVAADHSRGSHRRSGLPTLSVDGSIPLCVPTRKRAFNIVLGIGSGAQAQGAANGGRCLRGTHQQRDRKPTEPVGADREESRAQYPAQSRRQ